MSLPQTHSLATRNTNLQISKELHQRLKHLVEDSHHSIRSTQEFLNTIKDTKIEEDEIMVSFDVTALFTSININLAKETLTTLLEEPKTHTPDTTNLTSKDNIIKLVDLCLTIHFTFNDKTYRQTNGTPMVSPISGFLAEAVMQRLEQTALPIIQTKLWVCYVDDTFVITEQNKLEETFKTINNTLTGITFTKEEENNNKLPFLDVTVERTVNGELQTSVYRKTTHTDQILNYRTNHPNTHKRSCIRTLFQRATTHCSTEELRRAEENHLYSVFKKNGYPMNTVRRFLSNKPKQTDKTGPETIITLPYIKDISEMNARLLGPLGIMVAHKPTNTLKQQLMNLKDPIQTTSKTNVIYKIPCQNCDKHYIGQTGRKLATRIHEHQLATKRHDPLSLVSLHTDEEGHHFDWDNASILRQAKQRHA
ncbi:uncharacterized protein LOC125446408 isoform X2 [Stegostoma tigrinum]|nr:uncharacterized protein LOC125446408 isoform X2 [Stegostoma tigrinum]XP_059495632.1 uncharacterized protein LOC125446408 isoform X2 [Stegostoma tigrinum]XP_059495633.1 uncharacterized protein LOC125446408 isoform X2 [Stegostoma tigrinum]